MMIDVCYDIVSVLEDRSEALLTLTLSRGANHDASAEDHQQSFDARHVSTTMLHMARLGIQPSPPLLSLLMSHASTQSWRYTPSGISSVLWAIVTLKIRDSGTAAVWRCMIKSAYKLVRDTWHPPLHPPTNAQHTLPTHTHTPHPHTPHTHYHAYTTPHTPHPHPTSILHTQVPAL